VLAEICPAEALHVGNEEPVTECKQSEDDMFLSHRNVVYHLFRDLRQLRGIEPMYEAREDVRIFLFELNSVCGGFLECTIEGCIKER
jgi:hypothetical protein